MYQTTSLNLNQHFRTTSVSCSEDGVTFSICNQWQDDEVIFHMEAVTNYILQMVDDDQLSIIEDMTDAERVDYVHDVYEDDFFDVLVKKCSMAVVHAREVVSWDSFNAFADFIDGWAIEAVKNPSRVPAWIAAVLNNMEEMSYTDLTEYENKALNILRSNYHQLIACRAQSFSGLSSMFGNLQSAYN